MIRPWHRSRLFWLGIPGLVFLLWAWGKSNVVRVETSLRPGRACSSQGKLFWYRVEADTDRLVTVDYAEGNLLVLPNEYIVTACCFPVPRGFTTTEPVLPDHRRWFPPPRWRAEQLDALSYYRFVSLPYWLLTGGYAGVWLGGMGWWQRRKARLLKASTMPPS